MEFKSVNKILQESIVRNWDRPCVTNYQGMTLAYRDVARRIAKLHIAFEQCGLKKGDKVAICSRNQANWGVSFLAAITYGAVAVPILHEFKPGNIHYLVNHSEARVLFVDDVIWEGLVAEEMPELSVVVQINTFKFLHAKSQELAAVREHLNEEFGHRYPNNFEPEDVNYYEDSAEELAIINYTSGTSGFSKGVMIPYRALWSNYDFACQAMGSELKPGDNVISILPMAHMYGMAFEFSYEFLRGCHVYYLNRVPSPAIIAQAFAEVKPAIIIAVPLVIEKIIRKRVFPKIQNNYMRLLLGMPVISKKIRERICEEVKNAFGGRFFEIIVGGAAFNQEVEQFLHRINFPYTVGYGATECAPIICYRDWREFVPGSCGRAAKNMEVKILSPDPHNVPGEILTRGLNVMLGYYKNEEATRQTIDKDGWYHTGDLGTIDEEGNVFINGRSKNMLLSANGQNIYPEEIEDKLNSLAMVVESIVVQRESKLVALVHPDQDEAKNLGLTHEDLQGIMEQNLLTINQQLPAYEKLSEIVIHDEEFAKTPKKSIKRYLYT